MATTVVNSAPAGQTEGNGVGTVLAVILLFVLVVLFLVYGIPALRGGISTGTTGTSTAPQVNVPGKVDVNINHSTK